MICPGRRIVRIALALCCLAGVALAQEAEQHSLETLTTRAEAGDSTAQAELARRYHEGLGVVQNFTTAAQWARSAAEAGTPAAQNLLARYHHARLGVKQDQAEALRWFEAAAATGDPGYLLDLGHALENGADGSTDPARAAQAYAQAAEKGHPEAQVSLGLLYQEGRGVEQDYARARTLYEDAAATGHPRARNNLGLLYVRGHGVLQDYEKAAELFAQAAEAGLPGGLRNLGVMYENGFGVPVDEARAAELYRLAGQSGGAVTGTTPTLAYDPRLAPPPSDEDSLQALSRMAQAGDPVAEFQLAFLLASTPEADAAAIRQAAQLFERAAQAGHGPSMRNLGLLYFEGRGVPQDYVLGQMWLTLAGSVGQSDAPALMQQLGGAMTPEQITEAQGRAEAWAQRNL